MVVAAGLALVPAPGLDTHETLRSSHRVVHLLDYRGGVFLFSVRAADLSHRTGQLKASLARIFLEIIPPPPAGGG